MNVEQWIKSGCDSLKGLHLMEKYGASVVLIRMYAKNPEQHKEKIKEILVKLSGFSATENTVSVSKKAIPFRDQFPFIESPDCPMELKALVSDKFSSFFRYRQLHKKLCDCGTLDECSKLAGQLIENYLENRLIYQEFEFYKQNKIVLGKHPIFKQYENIRAIRKLNIKELVKKQSQLNHAIWRIESELKKGDRPDLEVDRKNRLDTKKAELAEVKRLLGE